jgi:hypothetical protein
MRIVTLWRSSICNDGNSREWALRTSHRPTSLNLRVNFSASSQYEDSTADSLDFKASRWGMGGQQCEYLWRVGDFAPALGWLIVPELLPIIGDNRYVMTRVLLGLS